jgi:vacuolar-type H+-ATPase subunit H
VREVIEAILKEEHEAKQRIADAREKAKAMQIEAEEKARQLQEDKRKAAEKKAKKLILDTEKAAVAEKEAEILKEADYEKRLWDSRKTQINRTVERLFHMVVSGPGKD